MEGIRMSNQDSAMAPETLSFLHESKKAHLIGGHWADYNDEKRADVFDPSTGAVITTVPLGGQAGPW